MRSRKTVLPISRFEPNQLVSLRPRMWPTLQWTARNLTAIVLMAGAHRCTSIDDGLTAWDRCLIARYLRFDEALDLGRRSPATPLQAHVVAVLRHGARPCTQHEIAYVRDRRSALRRPQMRTATVRRGEPAARVVDWLDAALIGSGSADAADLVERAPSLCPGSCPCQARERRCGHPRSCGASSRPMPATWRRRPACRWRRCPERRSISWPLGSARLASIRVLSLTSRASTSRKRQPERCRSSP